MSLFKDIEEHAIEIGAIGGPMRMGEPRQTTIQDALDQAANRGYQLNNLFQMHDGAWQASFRFGESYFEFGRGRSAVASLTDALEKASRSIPVKEAPDPRQSALPSVFE